MSMNLVILVGLIFGLYEYTICSASIKTGLRRSQNLCLVFFCSSQQLKNRWEPSCQDINYTLFYLMPLPQIKETLWAVMSILIGFVNDRFIPRQDSNEHDANSRRLYLESLKTEVADTTKNVLVSMNLHKLQAFFLYATASSTSVLCSCIYAVLSELCAF
jgi:hypothetical protein